MTPTLNTPITAQRLKLRNSKSGQYNTAMALLRRLDKEAGRVSTGKPIGRPRTRVSTGGVS